MNCEVTNEGTMNGDMAGEAHSPYVNRHSSLTTRPRLPNWLRIDLPANRELAIFNRTQRAVEVDLREAEVIVGQPPQPLEGVGGGQPPGRNILQ